MKLAAYFDDVPKLRMQDPLASLFGGVDNGILEYGYADAVRVAGHSCSTVAASYWLTCLAMEHLYPSSLPQRGGIAVKFREDPLSGSTGVMATVVQMLTGAAGSTGFKGIAGRYRRVGLMSYAPELLLSMRFMRTDTRVAVDADANLSLVPDDPSTERLLQRCIEGRGTPKEAHALAERWQARVKHLLLDLARDPAVFVIRAAPVRRTTAPIALAGWPRAAATFV
jgi:formylmethanofuran dehydrogenase subunit E